jgi:hypothetical protein
VREGVELQEQISFEEIVLLHTLSPLYFTIPSYIEYALAKFADDNENFLL